jgi:gluconolactonase
MWSLPAELHSTDGFSEWARTKLQVDSVHSFLEGPCFDPHANLLVSDIPQGRIFSISPAGETGVIADYEGEPNGLAVHSDGTVLTADYQHGLLALDPGAREPRTVAVRYNTERFRGLSDLVLADIYFTDQGQSDLVRPTGRVFRYREGTGVELLICGSDAGLQLSGRVVQPGDLLIEVPLLLKVRGPSGRGPVGVERGFGVAVEFEEVGAHRMKAAIGVDPAVGFQAVE